MLKICCWQKIHRFCKNKYQLGWLILSQTRKNSRITKNCVHSFPHLRNGMFQMVFFFKIDFYGVKKRQIRYIWMHKIDIYSIMYIFQIWIKVQNKQFFDHFFQFLAKKTFVYTFENIIFFKRYNKLVSNKFCIITIILVLI